MADPAVWAIRAARTLPGFLQAYALGREVDALDTLRSLQHGWDRLAGSWASPMQHFVWAEAVARAYRNDGHVRVVTVGSRHEPRALAALLEHPGPIRRLEALGVRQIFEPMDLLYADRDAAHELAAALVAQGRALSVSRLPADSAMIAAFKAACRNRALLRVVPTAGCPYIELGPEAAEPERRFNAGRRSDFRRAQRHAEKLGKVRFEVLTPAPHELPALLDEAWAVEAAGWKGANGSALALRPRRAEFFRRYALAACRNGLLRLCFMRIDGRAVAMQLASECGGRFWLFKIGYDESFERCSPGNLLMLHTVRYAALRGLRSYEFLGCAAAWTEVWTKAMRECVALRVYPFTARGTVAASLDTARFAWRRLRRRL